MFPWRLERIRLILEYTTNTNFLEYQINCCLQFKWLSAMMTKTLIFLYSPSLAFTPFPNLPPGGKERQHCLKLFTLERRSKPSFSPMGGGACKAFPPWGIPITPKIRMSDLRVDFKVTRSKFLMIFLLVLLISSIYVVLFYVRKRVKYWIIDISW